VNNAFFHRKIVRPVVDLLRQGITPEKIALSIACGLILGIFPALGWTTLLCFLAAVIFQLNLPAVQLVNYFVYPLQLLLLIPFIRAGEILFHSARMPLSLTQILALIKTDAGHAIRVLWVATVHAVAVWALIAPLSIYVISKILTPALQRLGAVRGMLSSELPVAAKEKADAVIR
jgi:uncharacterized protein (DUF2062 family)